MPHALVHVCLFHGYPSFRNARQGAAVGIYSCRINEDGEDECDHIGACDEEDVCESVRLVTLVDGVCWGKEDEAEKDSGKEDECARVEESLEPRGRHGGPRMVCKEHGWWQG